MHTFDKQYWEEHWEPQHAHGSDQDHELPPHPRLAEETRHLTPGSALDAGCGTGTEAAWLAQQGWQVTGADISAAALASAAGRAAEAGMTAQLTWAETDLTIWEPAQRWDLVTTHYAHSSIPQLELYRRLSRWVSPGGTLLIIAHAHRDGDHSHPEEATATLEGITELFTAGWEIETAREHTRQITRPGGRQVTLDDAVVRARRIT